MKARVMPAGEFKAKCLEVMDRVAATGGRVIITKRGAPVAELIPAVRRPRTLFGFMQGRLELIGDVVSPVRVDWNASG